MTIKRVEILMKNFNIDVVVVTRNRYFSLLKCVNNLCDSLVKPTNIIIVDGSDILNLSSKKKVQGLGKKYDIGIRYYKVPHKGVGYSRNFGLKKVKSSFFAFIDDDEYVPKKWLAKISEIFASRKNVHVVCGPKIPKDPNNYWSRIWIEILKDEFSYEGSVVTFPSGNSSYRTDFIRKNNLHFDSRLKYFSEDLAFSMALNACSAEVYFSKNIWVEHNTRTTFFTFTRQWFYYGVGKHIYHNLYFDGGTLAEPLKYVKTLINFNKTFPYKIKTSDVTLWPGIILLHVAFLFGYLFSFLNLIKK